MPSSTPPLVPPLPPNLQPLPSAVVGWSTRVDLREIKSKIIKRIGPAQAKKYFGHLESFLSSKLNKTEFDKLCLVILGHESLVLHNHLVRSILHNVCRASRPLIANAPKPIGGATNSAPMPICPIPVWGNGDNPHHHVNDCHPPSQGADAHTLQSALNHRKTVSRENGARKRLAQLQHSELIEPLAKRSRVENALLIGHGSPHSNGPAEVVARENCEEAAQCAQGQVHAPLGILFCPAGLSASRKLSAFASNIGGDSSVSCYELGELCDLLSLRKRMEKITETEGLEGASPECANLLNNGIDVFLKQLIRSCVELIGARSQLDRINHVAMKHQLSQKLINGEWQQNHVHGQGGRTHMETSSISLQDFRVMSELNPLLLGVNASLLCEKINSYD